MRRLILAAAILCGLAFGYFYPPLDASRLYLYPYWATNPRADVAHYPMSGYFALFGEDSLNSIRMYRSPADSMPYFRLVTKAGDTVRFNRGGIYTTGDLWAQTVHYTALDPPVAGGGDSSWLYLEATDSAKSAKFIGPLTGNVTGDVSGSSGSCTGQAATVATIAGLTADTTAGGAARATLAANATNAYNTDSLGHKAAARYDTTMTTGDSLQYQIGTGVYRLRSSWNMPQTLADGSTINWNLALGGCAKVTLGGNRTLANPTGIVNGTKVQLFIVQDSTGSRTLTWGAHYKFCGGAAPTLTATGWPTPGGDLFEFVCYSDSLLYFANFCPALWP